MEERHRKQFMVNNGYIAFALMGMVLATPYSSPTQYKDTEYTKNIANKLPTTPTPTPIPTPTATPSATQTVIVRTNPTPEVIVETVVVEVPVTPVPTPEPEQTLAEAVMTNVAGKVYGYEKNDKGKK